MAAAFGFHGAVVAVAVVLEGVAVYDLFEAVAGVHLFYLGVRVMNLLFSPLKL